ncbi:hypothetical protein BROOK1789B_2118 [Bathymodiolus brooksi thiotrophic gill symbiont]|nr:hypothetical protein BROOK1789B_2118 [Bathymodiolus brooksi thiotrophic gill symbiont]
MSSIYTPPFFSFSVCFPEILIDVCTCYFSVPMVLTTSSFS